MLYDPKWEKSTKADPMSLESLIAWLKIKNPCESYDYTDAQNCLVGQYRVAHGLEPHMPIWEMREIGWNYIAKGPDGAKESYRNWTFGAALERALKVNP